MMPYAKTEDIRLLTNIQEDEVNDSVLTTIRDRAEQKIIKDLTIERVDEGMEPNLDGTYLNGSNNTFYTNSKPIADIDRDGTISSDDITVKIWEDFDNEGTVEEVTIDNVTPETGRVILSSPPGSEYDKITATYSFYNSPGLPDWDLLELASVYLSGYMSVVKTRGKVPSKYSVGDLSIDEDLPGQQLLREYRSVLNRLREDIR